MSFDLKGKIRDAAAEIVPVFLRHGQSGSSIKLRISAYTLDIALNSYNQLFVDVYNGRREIEDELSQIARKAAGLN